MWATRILFGSSARNFNKKMESGPPETPTTILSFFFKCFERIFRIFSSNFLVSCLFMLVTILVIVAAATVLRFFRNYRPVLFCSGLFCRILCIYDR